MKENHVLALCGILKVKGNNKGENSKAYPAPTITNNQIITVYVLDRNSLSLNYHNSFIFFNIRINNDRKSGY